MAAVFGFDPVRDTALRSHFASANTDKLVVGWHGFALLLIALLSEEPELSYDLALAAKSISYRQLGLRGRRLG